MEKSAVLKPMPIPSESDRDGGEPGTANQPAECVADVGAKLFEHEHLDAVGSREVLTTMKLVGPDRGCSSRDD